MNQKEMNQTKMNQTKMNQTGMNQTGASFFRQFFSLYIALVLQNVVTLSVNLTDNVMLGAYSETSLAGVAAATPSVFVYQMRLAAFG